MAEYRVFVLKISRAPATTANAADKPTPSSPSSKIVQSTLDPEQYLGYFPLEKGESIVYVDTWKCPGRTGDFQPLCQRSSARPSSKLPTAP